MPDPADKSNLQGMLERACNGDQAAWRFLVDSYTPRVFGLIRAQCGNPDLAEEITQSTFCTIAEKLRNYREMDRFEPWLFRIAMNRLRDEMRRRKRQARPVEDAALAGLAGADPDAADPSAAPAADVSGPLRDALGKLSDADRRIVDLRHFAGLSFKQIAEVQGQPLGTVLARHHRALKKIKDLLGPDFLGDMND